MGSAAEASPVVLVVAPRFPSINQPWIDTYLEQLLRVGFEPLIYSVRRSAEPYQEKVDRLGLRGKVLPFQAERKDILQWFARGRLLSSAALKGGWRAWRIRNEVGLGSFESFLKGAYWCHQLSESRPAVIHAHGEAVGYELILFSRLAKIPFVLTFHGLPPTGVQQLSEGKRKILYRHAAAVLVNTRFAEQQVLSLGCAPGKVRIIPQGLPLADFPFHTRPRPSLDNVRVVSVGRFHRDKGQAYSLLALARLARQGVGISWTFVGVGPDLDRLRKLADALEVSDRVTFLQGISSAELLDVYYQHHLLVLASVDSPGGHVETQGVVLQEAQATGCVPIATRVGGIPECLNDGVDAVLVRQRSSREIMTAIMRVLNLSQGEWESLQVAARNNVVVRFSADAIGDQVASCLHAVNSSTTN